jgi:putative peptidoglycan lipid II flippase
MRAMFGRGAFTAANAQAAAATLTAYAIGLLPFVLMRSLTVTFLARGDTTTPVVALFFAVLINVGLKILLMDRYAQVGLAFATSIGAWVNFALLIWLATRKGLITLDDGLKRSAGMLAIAGLALAAALFFGQRAVAPMFADWPAFRDVATLVVLAVIGAVVYFGIVFALVGKQWLAALSRSKSRSSNQKSDMGADY